MSEALELAAAVLPAPGAGRERRELLLDAAFAGLAPPGGPVLSRREIEAIRAGGDLAATILLARAAAWDLSEAGEHGRETALGQAWAAAGSIDRLLGEMQADNDFAGAKLLLPARNALGRALGTLPGSGSGASRIDEESLLPAESPPAAASPAHPRPPAGGGAAPPASRRSKPVKAAVSLGFAVALVWLLRPPALPPPPSVPDAAALSSELGLVDPARVGNQLFVRSTAWTALAPERRQAAVHAACERARRIGLSGLVIHDLNGERVSTCEP